MKKLISKANLKRLGKALKRLNEAEFHHDTCFDESCNCATKGLYIDDVVEEFDELARAFSVSLVKSALLVPVLEQRVWDLEAELLKRINAGSGLCPLS
jgi:hypothetical protein